MAAWPFGLKPAVPPPTSLLSALQAGEGPAGRRKAMAALWDFQGIDTVLTLHDAYVYSGVPGNLNRPDTEQGATPNLSPSRAWERPVARSNIVRCTIVQRQLSAPPMSRLLFQQPPLASLKTQRFFVRSSSAEAGHPFAESVCVWCGGRLALLYQHSRAQERT